MKALPPPPYELDDEGEAGRLPPGAPLALILMPSLIFWAMVVALLWRH